MAGAAGINVDHAGFIMDPTLPDVKQYWKEMGMHPYLDGRKRHILGGYRTVQIPTASVLTLNTVPIQLVPAAGVGTIIVPTMVVASLVFNANAYSMNSGGASLRYGTAGAGTSTGFTLSQAFVQSASGTNVQVVNQSSAATYLPLAADANVPLTLIAASSDPTTGDSDLFVRVYFMIVTVPLANPSVP